MIRNEIIWSQFEVNNPDVTTAFEQMCRMLFKKQFLNKKVILNSRPNHPGVEVSPIIEEETNKKISFQAKYFEKRVDYQQIKKSVLITLQHYTKELDIFYLYCNKELDTESKTYQEINKLLVDSDIELIPITNFEIISLVYSNPAIGELFFGKAHLTQAWFKERIEISLSSMGTRYNSSFNVKTRTEKNVRMFLKNEDTIEFIREKKEEAIKELINIQIRLSEYKNLIARIINYINNLKMESYLDIDMCLKWKEVIESDFCKEINELEGELVQITDTSTGEVLRRKEALNELINFPELLKFSELDMKLIRNNVLIIEGEAGSGKTQLLSNVSNEIVSDGGYAVLIAGQIYINSESLQEQTMKGLNLDLEFNQFLGTLEEIGDFNNSYTYIFFDAVNESVDKNIWKIGLPNIINEVNKLEHVKLVISVREGYSNFVFDEYVENQIYTEDIIKIKHTGFYDNSVEAINEFLNYYGIPFSPTDVLQSSLVNPLFLTLFCKTYEKNRNDYDFNQLFEKFIVLADNEAKKQLNIVTDSLILKELIKDIVNFQIEKKQFCIERKKLLTLDFWNINGLDGHKLSYITSLTKSGVLLAFIQGGCEFYKLGYNLFEDFITAETIIEKFSDENSLKQYIKDEVLQINNSQIENYENIDVFIAITNLYFKKYRKECIDIIDDISSDFQKNDIFTRYIESYSLRATQDVSLEYFNQAIQHNDIDKDVVIKVLIENSVKLGHDLNAHYLHELLMNMKISERDYFWTTYINDFSTTDERLFQLIVFLESGKKLELSKESAELLLILLSWNLTSSNRLLRDKTSKAMIEILKVNFSLCLLLLKNFRNVDDPYVIQRLFAVILGACLKSINKSEEEYKELAVYVYEEIFNKEKVYPDILLRDYAKLIVERFLYEYKDECLEIESSKIRPPYKSDFIPRINFRKYDEDYTSGLSMIEKSMAPDTLMHAYGDFGRYVFQAALKKFDGVDVESLYNYALDFIENKLGYDNKLFTRNDSFSFKRYSYGEKSKNKIERIGKKYQWIAMYNILARVSDCYKMSSEWSGYSEYEGAWNPFVRDFDPTLNCKFLNDLSAPHLKTDEENNDIFISRKSTEEEINKWVGNETENFFALDSDFLIEDQNGDLWVSLFQYKNYENHAGRTNSKFTKGFQEVWEQTNSYFISNEEFDVLYCAIESDFCDDNHFFENEEETYVLFNRECGWSSNYKKIFEDSWVEYQVETGEYNVENIEEPDFSAMYGALSYSSDETDEIKFRMVEMKTPIRETIAKTMKTTNRVIWEAEYDASQETALYRHMPCELLFRKLNLKQKEYEDSYYNEQGDLVAFNCNYSVLGRERTSFLIKQKKLEDFMKENNLKIFWISNGEKRFVIEERSRHQISTRNTLSYFEGGKLIKQTKINNH